MASTGSLYNHSRLTRQLLRRHRKHPASFSLQLHPTWIRFEDSAGKLLLEEPVNHEADALNSFGTDTLGGPSTSALVGSGRADGSSAAKNGRSTTPGKELLRCIRDQQLPNCMLDILDIRGIPFFEGTCTDSGWAPLAQAVQEEISGAVRPPN